MSVDEGKQGFLTLEQAKNLKEGDIVIGPNFGFEYTVMSVDYWALVR